jgi:ABC-type transporter Mla subunit MlaD
MKDKLERMWKKTATKYSKVLSQHSSGGTGANYRNAISIATVLTKIVNRQQPNARHVMNHANLVSEIYHQLTQESLHQHG